MNKSHIAWGVAAWLCEEDGLTDIACASREGQSHELQECNSVMAKVATGCAS